MKPLISWNGIQKLPRPPRPIPGKSVLTHNRDKPGNMWDNRADFYDKMVMTELPYKVSQINYLDITGEDTVLDKFCGSGRISIKAVERAASLTFADESPKMLLYCKRRARERERDNLATKLIDRLHAAVAENMQKYDNVIASRTLAMEAEKMGSLANQYAAVIICTNVLGISILIGKLFEGTGEDGRVLPMVHDRKIRYYITDNKVFGYDERNVRVLNCGFTKMFPDRKGAYEFLLSLRPEAPPNKDTG